MDGSLFVYLDNTKVGELTHNGILLSFRYDQSYLSTTSPLPLSRHLPLQAEAFSDEESRGFFANLLPEGGIRNQVARQVGVSAENVFALLEAIGGDCAGAISLMRPEDTPNHEGTYRPITEEELSARLSDLPTHPFLAGEEGVRLSLAGAQNKLPVFFDGTRFFIPEGTYPSSHILKTAIAQLEGTVINETFCMTLATRVGLPVPATSVVSIGGQQVYMIERYDRKVSAGGVQRLHQEDFCQTLGIPPELKYEKEGGPGFKDCFKLVEEWSAEPLLDNQNLLKWALFNFLIGNADAHGKNLSFLYSEGAARLAPFYDIINTAVYERVNNKFAMKMGGQNDPRYLLDSDLKHFADEIEIDIRMVKSLLGELVKDTALASLALAEIYKNKYGTPGIVDDILRIISQRIAKAKVLTSPDVTKKTVHVKRHL